MERLVAAAPKKEAEITGFKSDLTKKTASLSAVWGKFSSRLREREKALRQAATFYERVSNVRHTCHVHCTCMYMYIHCTSVIIVHT